MGFSNLFEKKKVKLLLQNGLIYYTDKQNFYADSFNDIGFRKKKVFLYRDKIRKIIDNNPRILKEECYDISETLKLEIAVEVKRELEKKGIDVEIIPSM